MNQKKIAVIGACCSRDMFNHNFVTNYKEYFDLQYYSFQTSFISIMAHQIPYNRALLKHKDNNVWFRDILTRELEKNFCNDLISIRPDNLLIDFYSDVYNGVIEIQNGKSYVSNRIKDMQNNLVFTMIPNTRQIKPINNRLEYFNLFKESLKRFFNFMKTFLPLTKIIVNVPEFSDEIENEDGSISKFEKSINIVALNEIYNEFVEYAKSINNDIEVIYMNGYKMSPNYYFGAKKWIVHYTLNYYKDLINKVYDQAQDTISIYCYDHDTSYNLLINHNFNNKTLFYKHWSNIFAIDDNKTLTVFEKNNMVNVWQTVWSGDLAVRNDYQYEVSFEFYADSCIKLLDDSIILIIRVFDKQNQISKNVAVQKSLVKFNGVYDKWEKYCANIRVSKGKYLSIGFCCMRNGLMKWRNIVINNKINNSSYSSQNINEILGITDCSMIDVNNSPIIYN